MINSQNSSTRKKGRGIEVFASSTGFHRPSSSKLPIAPPKGTQVKPGLIVSHDVDEINVTSPISS
jgi:hypothetical protein